MWGLGERRQRRLQPGVQYAPCTHATCLPVWCAQNATALLRPASLPAGASFFYKKGGPVPFEGQEVRAFGLLLDDLVQRLELSFDGERWICLIDLCPILAAMLYNGATLHVSFVKQCGGKGCLRTSCSFVHAVLSKCPPLLYWHSGPACPLRSAAGNRAAATCVAGPPHCRHGGAAHCPEGSHPAGADLQDRPACEAALLWRGGAAAQGDPQGGRQGRGAAYARCHAGSNAEGHAHLHAPRRARARPGELGSHVRHFAGVMGKSSSTQHAMVMHGPVARLSLVGHRLTDSAI